eukprot:XP_025002177.1 uncharacterized protein LOC107050300 [Gallus gallus]
MAFRYLSWLLFLCWAAMRCTSLLYLEHKGWYSWLLGMLYGFLLTFGFITMTPQLFINYKLQSVAHLPWRMLSYKALNTFIDDLFAFVIRMPIMYRIGCLRDGGSWKGKGGSCKGKGGVKGSWKGKGEGEVIRMPIMYRIGCLRDGGSCKGKGEVKGGVRVLEGERGVLEGERGGRSSECPSVPHRLRLATVGPARGKDRSWKGKGEGEVIRMPIMYRIGCLRDDGGSCKGEKGG